jgi:hypothetical protein
VLAGIDRPWLPWALLGLMLLVGGAFLYRSGHDQLFWYDEWDFLLQRRGDHLSTFLEPHNEHLSLVPIAIYKLLLAVAGMDDYGPYRLTLVGLHLLCVLLLFVYAQRRVGGWPALAAAALILFLGPAWQVILWPFELAWIISLAAGLGALLLLDRGDRLGEVGASVLLLVSLASSGVGIAVAAGVLVEVLWRPDRWRRLWIAAAPLLVYGIWYVGYSDSHVSRNTLPDVPGFVADAAAATVASLAGLSGPVIPESANGLAWGRPLAVVAVVALVWRLSRIGGVSARVAMLLAGGVGFWTLTAVGRAGFAFAPPSSPRYVYVGALFVVLIAVELLRGVSLGRTAAGLLAAALAVVLVANVGALRDASRYLRERSAIRAANLGAMEIGRDSVDPGFITAPYITARAYLAAAAVDGSPALSPAEISVAPEEARASADDVLVRIHRVALVPGDRSSANGPRPAVEGSVSGTVRSMRSCVALEPSAYRPAVLRPGLDLAVPPGGLVLSARGGPAELSLRRFAAAFPSAPLGTLTPGGTAILRIPRDRASEPWHVHISPTAGVTACGLGRQAS